MVVDLLVPEEGLVTVSPGEVLGPDVLVGILDALLEGREVAPVLPMLVPEVIGVQAGEEDARRDTAVKYGQYLFPKAEINHKVGVDRCSSPMV